MHRFTHVGPVTQCLVIIAAAVTAAGTPTAAQDNPVYVNDSPAALAMLRQAEDQVRDNPGEAIRLFQALLDEYPMKLVPVTEDARDQFVSVRRRVLRNIRSNDALLDRYQLVATPEAARMAESGQFERLAVTRSLTEPGLVAMLNLAQAAFESAHFNATLRWLEQAAEHPDCVGRAAEHAWYMRAVASHYLGRTADVTSARAQLEQTAEPGAALLQTLDQIIVEQQAPVSVHGHNVVTRTTPDAVKDLIAQPIWTRRLNESLLFRRFVDSSVPESRHSPVLDQRRRDSDLMTAAATVCGDFVYINEGFQITAFDRYMGDRRWSYVDSQSLSLLERDNNPPLDLNIMAVHGDALVTFTGHAHSDHRSGTGSVLCLDRVTGTRLWETRLDGFDLDTEMNDLYPHGPPIIADGTVFMLARKVSAQRLASTYAIALDLATGRLRWTRYLTSSGGLHRAGRPISAPTYSDGWLYVATPIGAMARLDSTTGEITWMRRFGVPINIPFQDQMRRPWEFSRPVVTAAGVLALQPDQRRVALLDMHTGDALQTFPASSNDTWGEVHYLLADANYVYAIGRDIRAFPIDALTRSLWTLPTPATSRMVDDQTILTSNTLQRLDLRGRVQLADSMLIVPSLQGVLFVDAETGQLEHRLSIPGGNPVVVDAQLFHAGSDQLDAYMSFERAQAMLRERMAAQPDDPAPALSLLRLAIRVGDMGLALSAADMAHRSIQMSADPGRSAIAQQELFSLLLNVDEQRLADVPQQAEALYVMLAAVAQGPHQRVEYLLAYGAWLSERDFGQAVETYQQLLSDDQLASVLRSEDHLRRPARAWAADNLRQLMSRHGDRVYAAQADFAQRQLDGLGTARGADVDALLKLAAEYPFAPAAVVATQRAADVLVSRGDRRAALAALLDHERRCGRPRAAAALLGPAVELALETQWTDTAIAILESAQSRFGGSLKLERAVLETGTNRGGSNRGAGNGAGGVGARMDIEVETWLAALRPGSGGQRLARLGPADQKVPVGQVPGRLLSMDGRTAGSIPGAGPLDSFVVAQGSVVKLHRGENEADWVVDLARPARSLLEHTARDVLLWTRTEQPEVRAVLLDGRDGSVRWMTPGLEELFGDATHAMIRAADLSDQMPNGDAFDPSVTLPLVCGGQLVLVRRIGQVAGFDRADGSQARWKLGVTMDQVHHAALTETSLVLMGVNRNSSSRQRDVGAGLQPGRPQRGAASFEEVADRAVSGRRRAPIPVLVVLDPTTGRVVQRLPLLDDEPAIWMRVDRLGRVVYGSDAGVAAVDVLTGRTVWSTDAYAAREPLAGWLAGDTAIFQERSRQLRGIDLDTGVMTESFDGPLRSDGWDPYELQDVVVVDDRIYALYPRRVVRYSKTGRILGQDVVTEDRDYRWLVPAKDQLLVLSVSSSQSMTPDAAGRRLQYVYSIYRLSPNCKLIGEKKTELPAHTVRAESVRVIDGWLLLEMGDSMTRLVPMPPASASP